MEEGHDGIKHFGGYVFVDEQVVDEGEGLPALEDVIQELYNFLLLLNPVLKISVLSLILTVASLLFNSSNLG